MYESMIKNYSHPPDSIKEIVSAVKNDKTLLNTDANLILVCGKNMDTAGKNGRKLILDYAKKYLKDYQFFVAEKIFEILSNKDRIDLLSLEKNITNFCDCILIILESESTFTELGAFAIEDNLVKNMLVINDERFKGENSFISLGPIAKINKKSIFKPVINTKLDSILKVSVQLEERLSKIKKQKRKRVSLSNKNKFDNLSNKIRMLFLLDLITLFHPIVKSEIIDILKVCYGDKHFDIDLDLHLLEALEMVSKKNNFFFRSVTDQKFFYLYEGVNLLKIRARVINHYHKYSPDRVSVLNYKVK